MKASSSVVSSAPSYQVVSAKDSRQLSEFLAKEGQFLPVHPENHIRQRERRVLWGCQCGGGDFHGYRIPKVLEETREGIPAI